MEPNSMRLIFVSDVEFLVAFVSDEKITTVFGHMDDFPLNERDAFTKTIYTEHEINSQMNIEIYFGRVDNSGEDKVLISSVNIGRNYHDYNYLETLVCKLPCSDANVSRLNYLGEEPQSPVSFAAINTSSNSVRYLYIYAKSGRIFYRTCSADGGCKSEKKAEH